MLQPGLLPPGQMPFAPPGFASSYGQLQPNERLQGSGGERRPNKKQKSKKAPKTGEDEAVDPEPVKKKSKNKGKPPDAGPPPEKVGDNDSWEMSKEQVGLKLTGEMAPDFKWQYPLYDESRRCFVAHLHCPLPQEQLDDFFRKHP